MTRILAAAAIVCTFTVGVLGARIDHDLNTANPKPAQPVLIAR